MHATPVVSMRTRAPAAPRRAPGPLHAGKTTTSKTTTSKTGTTSGKNGSFVGGPKNGVTVYKDIKKGEQPGFRFDQSMMRWVRDDRFAAMENTVVETKTGSNYTVWPVVHTQLTAKGIKSVTPKEALKMQSQGWTIVDVRIEGDFAKKHAAGAVCVPLFRFVQGTTFWDNVKKVAMASFAMKATERDPDYAATLTSKLKKGQKVILMCAIGGTLVTGVNLRPDKYPNGIEDPDRSFGRESRSLKAAYELVQAGWNSSNLVFVDGGFQQWRFQDLPMEASE